MTGPFESALLKVVEGGILNQADARAAFQAMLGETKGEAPVAAFLTALRMRGETPDEITGAAEVLRAHALKVTAPSDAVDTCGTGGDASGTYNVSTAAALVLAGLGIPVAKHGNRAQSSRSGSADVLKALGVEIDLAPAAVGRCISEAGIGFLFAPQHHALTRAIQPVRAALRFRTIFNLLGPLSNPAGVKRQLLGVFAERWVTPLAEVLRNLGCEHAWVVHGSDGLDEITTTGPTHVAALERGMIRRFTVTPEDAGITRALPLALKGGDAEHNALALKRLLEGEPGPYRDIVALNAAAVLVMLGHVETLKQGMLEAARAIDTGLAQNALGRLVARSHALKGAVA